VTDSGAKGDLSIAGKSDSVNVPLNVSDSKISGSLRISQSQFAIKQFSTMMGALKVKDSVEIAFEGNL